PEAGARLKSPQLFVQDDIKFRPNFTLNVGVRWEGWNGIREIHGNNLSFDPTITNPATQTLGAMWYELTAANGRTSAIAPIWNQFLPRVGFSWQPGANTVIHGGFGLYTYNFQLGPNAPGLGSALGATGNESDISNGLYPVVLLNSNGDTNYQGNNG